MRRIAAFFVFALSGLPVTADQPADFHSGPLAMAIARSVEPPGVDADDASALLNAMLEGWNGPGAPASALDPAEQSLLSRLTETQAAFAATLEGREQMVGPLLPDGRRILDLVFRGAQDPKALWLGSDDATTLDLARLYALSSPRLRMDALGFVVTRLHESWQASSVSTDYKPLSSDIAKAVAIFDAASPDTGKAGRRLLYDALKRVDMQRNNNMPDFLHEFLRS